MRVRVCVSVREREREKGGRGKEREESRESSECVRLHACVRVGMGQVVEMADRQVRCLLHDCPAPPPALPLMQMHVWQVTSRVDKIIGEFKRQPMSDRMRPPAPPPAWNGNAPPPAAAPPAYLPPRDVPPGGHPVYGAPPPQYAAPPPAPYQQPYPYQAPPPGAYSLPVLLSKLSCFSLSLVDVAVAVVPWSMSALSLFNVENVLVVARIVLDRCRNCDLVVVKIVLG